MKARIDITLKPGVLDPQGKAVEHALAALGFAGVGAVRIGKLVEIDLDTEDADAARASLDSMCQQLLANTVIERYTITLEG